MRAEGGGRRDHCLVALRFVESTLTDLTKKIVRFTIPRVDDLLVLDDPAQAASVLDPTRSRVLAHLRTPDSAAGAARSLRLPRQRLGYHVRELESLGLLTPVGERRVKHGSERLLQSTARRYVVSPSTLGAIGATPEEVRDRFSSEYLIATGARIVDDVGRLRALATEAGKTLPTLTIETEVRFASARDQQEFAAALSQAVASLTARYHDDSAPTGRAFRFVVAGHPTLPTAKRGPSDV
jgi:hypothetical protein